MLMEVGKMKKIKRIICILIVATLMAELIAVFAFAETKERIILSDYTDYYGRSALEKLPNAEALLYAYDNIAKGVEASLDSISVYNGKSYISLTELRIVLDVYQRDYAHHFWLGKKYSYSYYDENRITEYMPQYTMSGETLENAKTAFVSAADKILANITPSMTDYEKELILHDGLVKQVVYDLDAPHAHDPYGALVEGKAVCEGYAEAFQYLLHRAGIQSFLVIGSSRGEGHEWNVVKIDGKYYHVDPTWNDQGDTIFHAYFNMSDDMIKEDHAINATVYQMPVCDSMDAHYFTVNGRAVNSESCTVDGVAKLIKGNMPYAHVFVYGDRDAFLKWYGDNVVAIATKVGVVGEFSCGYVTLGREAALLLDGKIPEPEAAVGDVNGDESITNADVLAIYRYIYNSELYSIDADIADVNHDGYVTNADVLAIYRYIYNPTLYPLA